MDAEGFDWEGVVMCGIAGVYDPAAARGDELVLMLDQIRHRGPDDEGKGRAGQWQIGMRRLAIVDLVSGAQPMISGDSRWHLVFNGEIYNYVSLRQLLSGRGVRFVTESDTEVLLEAIAQMGIPWTLDAIEGMFAFCAVDTVTGDAWLARDRFGEKPLFVDQREAAFAFCSELGPLSRRRSLVKEVNFEALVQTVRYGYPGGASSAVSGITMLPPAHWMCITARGEIRSGRYWAPPEQTDADVRDVRATGDELLSLLDESVRLRLHADVPVGVFLSGGIDSGAVATSARRAADVECISIRVKAAREFDESYLVAATAKYGGLRVDVHDAEMAPYSAEVLDEMLQHYGQPFQDTSAVPTRLVSSIARQSVTVALSGDGGDELFGGYIAHLRAAMIATLGGAARPAGLMAGLLGKYLRLEPARRAGSLLQAWSSGLLMHEMTGVFSDDETEALFANTPNASVCRSVLAAARDSASSLWRSTEDKGLAASLFQIQNSLPGGILAKVDRMSMAESIEVRAPFLDSTLASKALRVPTRYKVRRGVGKWILRDALRRHGRLPSGVLSAPKRGFSIPLAVWLGSQFWRDLDAEIDEMPPGLLNRQAVNATAHAGRASRTGSFSYRPVTRAFLLYMILRWHRTMILK